MTRAQLEHIIRAAAAIADDDQIVVIGSQAVLGSFPDAPAELLVSNEADVYPRHRPERADLIDGAIGEGSPFHDTYGYYAHGVGPETAVLPAGWQDRLVPVYGEAMRGALGLFLDMHDLVLAKHAAGRDKDRDFARTAARHGLVRELVLLERLGQLPCSAERRAQLRRAIELDFATPTPAAG